MLFVGQLMPHKRPDFAIGAHHLLVANARSDARLVLAGTGRYQQYSRAVRALIDETNLDTVWMTGEISDAQLAAFYRRADVFVTASEHEGFCVPLIEAFYKQIPVLAYAATAVPATMDGAGVLFDTKAPAYVAALMDGILSNAELQDAIVEEQLHAVARLQAKDFDRTLLGFIKQILAAPRSGVPHVSFDFWQQFDMLEQLEEVRRYRPSAYFELPEQPA